MYDCGIVITARLKSSRLKEKALQKINNKFAIDILLDRVVNNKYPVIMAIPENPEDDILKEIAESKGIEVYRGYDKSPLHRLHGCANHFNFENVVRITIDDILIDLTVLLNQIKFHLRGNHEYTYCRRIPEGCAAEVIRTNVLNDVVADVGNKPIEFTSYYIKNKYNTFEYFPDMEYQFPYRLTLDYEEDLMMLRLIFACLAEPIGTLDIINFLKSHKYFLQINKLPVATIYTCNFNTSKYILDTIESVLNLRFQEFEFIIIDDHSRDDSMDRITEYYTKLERPQQEKIKILRNDKNIGLSACSNKALELARGKFIMRIDSDDVIKDDIIDQMLDTISIENTQACLSGYFEVDEKLNIISQIKDNMFHPACALISTWTANELKYQENIKYLEGKDFWERFQKKYKYSFLQAPLWKYRRRPGQKTQDKNHPNNLLLKKEST